MTAFDLIWNLIMIILGTKNDSRKEDTTEEKTINVAIT